MDFEANVKFAFRDTKESQNFKNILNQDFCRLCNYYFRFYNSPMALPLNGDPLHIISFIDYLLY
ncbi:MAG: hypothetical protein WDO19_30415 [Bacteroidota bacterium]